MTFDLQGNGTPDQRHPALHWVHDFTGRTVDQLRRIAEGDDPPGTNTSFLRGRALFMWLVPALGVAFILHRYLLHRSLWIDEATLALNVLMRSPMQLLQPLEMNQVAAPGFLLLMKFITAVLGPSEWPLRVLPLSFAVGSLCVFRWAVADLLGPRAALLGSAFLATNEAVIYYAEEVKQYSADMFAGVLILALAFDDAHRLSARTTLVTLSASLLLPWISQPSVFLLAALSILFVVEGARRGHTRRMVLGVACGVCGIASALVQFTMLKGQTGNRLLLEYWVQHSGFLPISGGPRGVLHWLDAAASAMVRNPMGLPSVGLGLFVMLVGTMTLVAKRPALLAFFGVAIAGTLAASAARVYPFGDRLLLFAIPLLAAVLGQGLDSLWHVGPRGLPTMGVILAVMLLAIPLKDAVDRVRFPSQNLKEDLRPVLSSMAGAARPADHVYVYAGALPAWTYYTTYGSITGSWTTPVLYGTTVRGQEDSYQVDVRRISSYRRVWLVFSHVWNDPVRHLDDWTHLEGLLQRKGHQLVCYFGSEPPSEKVPALACLYEFD